MNENISLTEAAGTILRRIETLAADLRAPAEFSRELADAFAFLADGNARVLLADSGVHNQARFVVRSLLGDENAETRTQVPLSEGVTLVVESAEKFTDAGTPVPADALLLLVDAAQAWTRTQDAVFRNALAAGMPVCVGLLGMSRIEDSERADVPEYVESQMKRHGNALLIELDDADGAKLDAAGAAMIRGFLEEALSQDRIADTRRAFARALFSAELEKLRPQLEKLRETDAAAQRAKDDAIFSARTATDCGELSWRVFERECSNYRRLAENALRGIFEEKAKVSEKSKKEKEIDGLVQSMSRSASVQDWWENTFRSELENRLDHLCEIASAKLKELLEKDARSLAQSASRTFGVPVEFCKERETVGMSIPQPKNADVGISGQTRQFIRVGALALGGGLAALTGGISIAIPNVLSEVGMWFWEEKSKKEAEKKVREYADHMFSRLKERFCAAAKSAYEELLSALKKAQGEWQQKEEKKISEMRETSANAELSELREKCEAAFAEIGDAVAKL